MRVAYVCLDPGVPVYGSKGCSVHVREVVHALVELGAQVDLYAARLGEAPDMPWPGVRVIPLKIGRHEGPEQRELAAMALNERMPELLARCGAYDLVYERYSLWSDRAMRWARQSGVPGTLEVNAPLIEEQQAHRGLYHVQEAERVRHHVCASASRIVAVSEEVADYVCRNGVDRSKLWVSPNSVDPKRFRRVRKPLSREDVGDFTVGFVGTLKPWHGVTELVKAFAMLRERTDAARLLIVGDGPQRGRVEALVNGLGLCDRVTMTGAVAPDHVPDWLAKMDVGVAPYPPGEHYFSPMKVMEYMAAGLPVVASKIGQVQSIVQANMGILCTPGHVGELSDALYRLRSDESLRRSMGRNGRAYVLRNHTWSGYLQEVFALCGIHQGQSIHFGAMRVG